MKKEDLVGLLLILGTILYFGAHVALAMVRSVLPSVAGILPR